jgi:hypothetical protein
LEKNIEEARKMQFHFQGTSRTTPSKPTHTKIAELALKWSLEQSQGYKSPNKCLTVWTKDTVSSAASNGSLSEVNAEL